MMKHISLLSVAIICAVLATSDCLVWSAEAPLLCDVAMSSKRPVGAPRFSDVSFSSRWKRPTTAADPHDSLKAAAAFYATRFDWVYSSDKEFIARAKAGGRAFFGTLNSMVPDWQDGKRSRGRILDLDGQPVTAPWMRQWKDPAWGCCNSPEWRESFARAARAGLDAGVDGFQMDDPGLNWTAIQWGGCFCDHCLSGFRNFLKERAKPQELAMLGIADVAIFDFKAFLRARVAPVGDAWAGWDDNGRIAPLKKYFGEFQKQSVSEFYRAMRQEMDAHAKRRVPLSCNNYDGRWEFPYESFDYGIAELPERSMSAATIYDRLRAAHERGKAQVWTLTSEDKTLMRRVIAASYASGGHVVVPWDVYLRSTAQGSDRYFGKPEDYADLYKFVRENAALFDGYEDAAFVIDGRIDQRFPEYPPLQISAKSVAAFVRAVPQSKTAPVVIHLVESGAQPQVSELSLLNARFFTKLPLRVKLLQPGRVARELPTVIDRTGERTTMQIPPLQPWAILLVSGATPARSKAIKGQ